MGPENVLLIHGTRKCTFNSSDSKWKWASLVNQYADYFHTRALSILDITQYRREKGGKGGRNINSETNHCTNQLNIKAHIVSKFTISKITTFKLIVVT
jgi:hypothetical protein